MYAWKFKRSLNIESLKCVLVNLNGIYGNLGPRFSTTTGKLAGNKLSNSVYKLLRYRRRMVRGPDPVESPLLTPHMVTSILQTNEVSLQKPGTVIKAVHCNQLAANRPNEDRRAEGKLTGTDKYLFGVFDGHAGCACAQSLKERLFHYIAVSMADQKLLLDISSKSRAEATKLLIENLPSSYLDDINPDLASLHWNSLLSFVNDSLDLYGEELTVEEKLKNAFLRLDQDISTEALGHSADKDLSSDAINIAFSGAVCCVVFVDGLDVYIANVGDTQAVLGSKMSDTDKWHTTLVTEEHDADNENEVKQLYQRHPNESVNILKGGRLFGELMPLRAFGDVRYKWMEKDFEHLKKVVAAGGDPDLSYLKHLSLPKNYRTPPYLFATPEIIHHRLSPKDRFLVLATDGLWDSEGIVADNVVSLVGHHTEGQQTLRNYQPKDYTNLKSINENLKKRQQNLTKRTVDKNSATHLIRHALGLEHGHVSAQLTLPQSLVRFYRDDITITVVYFDHHYVQNFRHLH